MPFVITFTYVTFAGTWNGIGHIIAVDYDRYYIGKYCSEGTHKRKYVPIECYECIHTELY